MIFQLLLEHLEQVLFVHRQLSLTHFIAAVETCLTFGRVKDFRWQRIKLAQQILKNMRERGGMFDISISRHLNLEMCGSLVECSGDARLRVEPLCEWAESKLSL